GEARLPPALGHRLEVPGCFGDWALLGNVVDPALNDEDVCADEDAVEPQGDLVGALAVYRGCLELEARIILRRPPLPLAPLVGSLDARANGRIRIPKRRSSGDRVPDDRDARH